MSEHPLVSLFVICYNHERYVVGALEAARKQTYPNIELIILDDCSTDNSVSIIEDWICKNDVECRFIKHARNVGVVKSLNECLRISTGEYISFFAGDDLIAPDKTSRLMAMLVDSASDVCLVYGDLHVIDENGMVVHPSFYEWYLQGMPPPSGDVFDYYFDRNPIQILGAVIKRRAYEVLGYYDESLVYEDWDMGMRMARRFKFLYCAAVIGSYRKFAGQMTDVFWNDGAKYKKVLESDFKMFSKHLDFKANRKRLLKKLEEIYLIQVQRAILPWPKEIKSSLLLLSNDIRYPLFWFLFLGSAVNSTSLFYRFFRKIFP